MNKIVKKLASVGAVEIKRFGFRVIDVKKLLTYACIQRNFQKDIILSFYTDMPVKAIEGNMSSGVSFTAYSAYRLYFNEAPADYSEIYVYADNEGLKEIKKRFKMENKKPNVFVLKKDFKMARVSLPLLYVDLWNLKEWYAKDFLNALRRRFKNEGILE